MDDKYEISKSLLESEWSGIAVAKRGNKLIRCGRGMRMFGVLTVGGLRRTITFDGEVVDTVIPSGIVVSGPVSVKIADMKGGYSEQ